VQRATVTPLSIWRWEVEEELGTFSKATFVDVEADFDAAVTVVMMLSAAEFPWHGPPRHRAQLNWLLQDSLGHEWFVVERGKMSATVPGAVRRISQPVGTRLRLVLWRHVEQRDATNDNVIVPCGSQCGVDHNTVVVRNVRADIAVRSI
jgi:hypothetical protein